MYMPIHKTVNAMSLNSGLSHFTSIVSICLSACQLVCPSLSICSSVSLSVCQFCPSVCLPLCLSVSWAGPFSVYPLVCLPVSMSVNLSVSLSVNNIREHKLKCDISVYLSVISKTTSTQTIKQQQSCELYLISISIVLKSRSVTWPYWPFHPVISCQGYAPILWTKVTISATSPLLIITSTSSIASRTALATTAAIATTDTTTYYNTPQFKTWIMELHTYLLCLPGLYHIHASH